MNIANTLREQIAKGYNFALAAPVLMLLLVLCAIAFLGSYAPRLEIDASPDALTLEGDQSLALFREIHTQYPSEDFLLITYRPANNDPLSSSSIATIKALTTDLEALEPVTSVMSITNMPLLYSPKIKLSDLSGELRTLDKNPDVPKALLRNEFLHSPVYEQLLLSADASTTVLKVDLRADPYYDELLSNRQHWLTIKEIRKLTPDEKTSYRHSQTALKNYYKEQKNRTAETIATVRNILASYRSDDDKIFLGGVSMIATDVLEYISSDLLVFGVAVLLFTLLLLTVIFRRVRWVLLPVGVGLLCCLGMTGLLGLLDWPITIVSSNFIAMLLIFNLSMMVHLTVRYREICNEYPSDGQKSLVKKTMQFMIWPCLFTATTSAAAFISLLFSGIRPVMDFGLMMSIGLLMTLCLCFTIFPAILLLLKRETITATPSDPPTVVFARIATRYSKVILLSSLLLAGISVVGMSRLQVENRFIDYFDSSTEIYQGMEEIDQLTGTIPLEIVLRSPAIAADDAIDDFDEGFDDDFGEANQENSGDTSIYNWFTRDGLERLENIHDHLANLPETGKVLSLATVYKVMKDLLGNNVSDVELAIAQRSLPPDLARSIINPMLAENSDSTRLMIFVKETSRDLNRKELLENIEGYLVNDAGFAREDFDMSGLLVLYSNMLQSLYRSQILTLSTVFLAIFIMFVFLFRSPLLALIAIAPNLLVAFTVLGGMGLFGIPLDLMTITIAAITIGIGVDNAIHYIYRFKREFALCHNYRETVFRCHKSIGRALFYVSATIIFGFSILTLSNFVPSVYFGLLIGIAMTLALLSSLLLLPELLVLIKPLGKEVEGKEEKLT